MHKYSRWTDNKNRLLIVLARWTSPVIEDGKVVSYKPTTVDLLDVHNETMNEMSVEDFDRYVQKGLLRQIIKI